MRSHSSREKRQAASPTRLKVSKGFGQSGEELLDKVIVAGTVMLTGAGCSVDFGGFLTEEMWSAIYNHPSLRLCPSIVKIMRTDFDYESIYHRILKNQMFTDLNPIPLPLEAHAS
jgi:hypothetical protein